MSTPNTGELTREQRAALIGALRMEDLKVHVLMGLLDEELIEAAESYGYNVEKILENV